MKKSTYIDNGVVLSKAAIKAGEEVEIKYFGLLKNAGARELKVHLGYNEAWEDAETLDMAFAEDCFSARIQLKKAGTLHCAFVDPAGNWDNNSGANYSFKVSATRAKKAAEDKKAPEKKKSTRAKKEDGASAKTKAGKSTRKSRAEKAFDEAAVSAADGVKKTRARKASKKEEN